MEQNRRLDSKSNYLPVPPGALRRLWPGTFQHQYSGVPQRVGCRLGHRFEIQVGLPESTRIPWTTGQQRFSSNHRGHLQMKLTLFRPPKARQMLALASLVLTAALAAAAENPSESPVQLVRATVQNELNSTDNSKFM